MRGFRAPRWFREEEERLGSEAEDKTREAEERSVREAEAALNENYRKLFEFQKREVLAGRPDPGFEIGENLRNLSMPEPQAQAYAKRQADLFVVENPDYYRTRNNFEAIRDYLLRQGINIPTCEALKQAYERLRLFGLLDERPAPERPAPKTGPVVEQPEISSSSGSKGELVDGFDLDTGEPRKYSQREIWKMSSADLKRAFRMWHDGVQDRRPRFTRSRFD